MAFEIEQKLVVADVAALVAKLRSLGVDLAPPIEQVDRYFNHPSRDFAVTDEALRLRRVGDANAITYKGPKLAADVKTRREIELPIAAESTGFVQFAELLTALGFRPVADVHKFRRAGALTWSNHKVLIALDEVDQLGTYCELEIIADDGLAAAQAAIRDLAARLGLTTVEQRSYLEMILGLKTK